jgi:hypothetical protein
LLFIKNKELNKIKDICEKFSFNNNGKLFLRLLTAIELDIKCNKIQNEIKISKKKDLKTKESIIM